MFESRLDVCRISDGVRSSIFAKALYANFEDNGFGSLACPQLKGERSAINYTVVLKTLFKQISKYFLIRQITTEFFPPFPKVMFPSGQVRFQIICHHHAKIPKVKKLVWIYSYIVLGAVFDGSTYKNYSRT